MRLLRDAYMQQGYYALDCVSAVIVSFLLVSLRVAVVTCAVARGVMWWVTP